jgi:hypothetical protein
VVVEIFEIAEVQVFEIFDVEPAVFHVLMKAGFHEQKMEGIVAPKTVVFEV